MDKEKIILVGKRNIKDKIYTIRDIQVMLDKDLAELYEVKTKRLNEQVKRNIERFPKEFIFQLTLKEKEELVANCDHLNSLKYSSNLPYVFTEQGVAMLSSVLKSKIAIKVSIQIINTFIKLRKILNSNNIIHQRLDNIETKQLEYQIKTDKKLEEVFDLLNNNYEQKQGIFFEGQTFDAHNFVSNLIRKATKSIILIDNYIDDNVLTLFNKRKNNVKITIYTKNISKELKLDLKKYNSQYKPIKIKKFNLSHDRFLIIYDNEIYHLGASLKDLGKKWFGFSKFNKKSFEILDKLK